MLKERIFEHFPTLKTERLLLRPLTEEDAQDLFEYASKEDVAKYVTWDAHQTIQDTKVYLNYVMQQYRSHSLAPWAIVLKKTNKLIGTIDFVVVDKQNKLAEIGYALSSDYWGQGIVTEAAKKVIEYGFTHMNLIRIQARCISENVGSMKVMKKVGMTYEGTLRQGMNVKNIQRDIMIFSILREEWKKEEPKRTRTIFKNLR